MIGDGQLIYETLGIEESTIDSDQNEKVEIVVVARRSENDSSHHTSEVTHEEKFIQAVYPHFKGKTKLELIDEIHDLQRRNSLLDDKVRNYENTINSLLTKI